MRFSAATTAERLLPESLVLRARPLLDRLDETLFSRGERGAAQRMSLIAFSIRILNAFIAIVSQVLLARWMGGFEYGIFVLVWVTAVIVGSLSCLGAHTAIIRYIPEYFEKGMLAELRGVLLTSRVFSAIASTLTAAIGIGALFVLQPWLEDYYFRPFVLGMIAFPMIALGDVLQGISRANSWAVSALSPTYFFRPILIIAFMALALAAGYPATAVTAVIAALAATYITTISQWIYVTFHADARVPDGPRTYLFSEWFKVSLPIFLVESFFFLMTNADVLMVGRYMEPHDVGIYYATVKTLALVHFVYFAVKAGVAQRYARFSHGENRTELAAFARETVSWTFWPSLAMAAIVLLIGKPLLGLYGPGFDEGYALLFPLAAGVIARAAVGPAESLLTMSGHQNACAWVYGVTLALNIALSMALIPLFGLWGAAFATAGSMVFEAAALSFTAWRKLGIGMAIFLPSPKGSAL